MASRAYRRDNHGRFAGSGAGTKVTYGKAGGFANAAFRGRVQAQKASPSKSLGGAAGAKGSRARKILNKKNVQRLAVATGTVALATAATNPLSRNGALVVLAGASVVVRATETNARPKTQAGRKVGRGLR